MIPRQHFIPWWVFPRLRAHFFFPWRRKELTLIFPSPYLVTTHGISGELRWAPGWVLRENEKVLLGFVLPKCSSPTHNFSVGSLVREPLWLSIIQYTTFCNELVANTLTRAGTPNEVGTVGLLHPQPGLLPLSREIILEETAQTKVSSSRAHVSKISNQGHFFHKLKNDFLSKNACFCLVFYQWNTH